MDEQEAQNYIDLYETKLESIPEAVEDFIYSEAYNGLIRGLTKQFSLSAEQQKNLDTLIFNIMNTVEIEEAAIRSRLSDLNLPSDQEEKLLEYIYVYFIEPTLSEITEQPPSEQEIHQEDTNKTRPSDTTAPAKPLGEQLIKPTLVTPTKREYGDEKPVRENLQKKFDPYHEPVDNS